MSVYDRTVEVFLQVAFIVLFCTTGQKFAMLELKSLLSKVLMNYKLCLGHPEEQLKLVAELVLRSQNGIRLKLERRK